jgi:hypothetical protein
VGTAQARLCPPFSLYGRVDMLVGGPTVRIGSASRANSHNTAEVCDDLRTQGNGSSHNIGGANIAAGGPQS